MSWYSRNAPFQVAPVSIPHELGYTHLVHGKRNYVCGHFRNETDAKRICDTWNERAAIDCMVEDSP